MDIVKSLKKVRRAVAGFSIATLVASFLAIGVAQAQTFPDVNPDDWFYNFVEELVTLGVVNSDNPTYRPADNVNRAEMAKLVVEAFDLTLENPAEATFEDVAADTWYFSYVETAVKYGIVGGYTDAEGNLTGFYGPADFLTREQAAKMIVLGKPLTENNSCDGFADVSGWSVPYVNTLYAYSIVDGYPDGSFGPNLNINRAEIAKIVSNSMTADASTMRPCAGFSATSAMALSSTTVELCYSQDYDETSAMMTENYMIEDADAVELVVSNVESSSDPMCVVLTTDAQGQGTSYDVTVSDVTSAAAMELVGNMTSFVGYVPGSTAEGDLTVTLNSSTAVGATLPSGATSVQMATWDFTAGSEDAMLKSLSVHKYGVAALPTGLSVYLYEDNNRLTSGKSVNSSTNLAVFNNLNLDIPAGETRSFTLRMDVGTVSATGEIGFEIADADAVDADMGFVFGDYPVQGELFGLSTTPAGTITIEKNGTITNPKVGEDNVDIAKFKLTAATEKAQLEQVNLLLTGSISAGDVENFKLFVSGETDPIAEVNTVNSSDLIAFDVSPNYEIAKGDTRSFTVKADFNTGRTSDTVKVYLDATTDLVAIGDTYGYGMTVTRTLYDGNADACASGSSADCSYSTLEGGDITMTSSGPVAADIAIAASDVTLLNFNINSVSDVTFKNFPIGLLASESADTTEGLLTNATTANFTDIKIINADTGATLMGPVDSTSFTTDFSTAIAEATDAAQAYYLFTDEFNMDAGEELNLSITADVANTSTLDGMTIVASVATAASASSYPEIRDVNNKTLTNSSSLVPNSSITGKTMTVSSPSLTVSLSAVPATTPYVKGKDGVSFTGVVLACGGASACDITDVALTGYIDDNADSTFAAGIDAAGNNTQLNEYVGSVWLEDDAGNVVATAKSVQSTTGTVTFDNVVWTLDAGETAIFYVVGDISVDAYKNSDGEYVSFAVAAGGVSYNDNDGNSRTSTGTANGTTSPSTYVSITDGGSLTIAVDPSTPKEDIVVAGTSSVEISKFRLTSTAEAFTVKKLAVNARQSAATTAALGDYDDNVAGITLEYLNEAGDTVTKNGFLSGGTASFTGLDLYVPKNDDATLTIKSTLNAIGGGADAATFVDLNIAFNNFEALAGDSGETYKADKIDNDVAATADLDFGTMTWTNGSHNVNLAVAALAASGTAQTLQVDDGAAATPENLPVGTLLCVSADTTCDLTAESVMVVTGWSEGTVWTDGVVGDAVTTLVLNDADTAFANDDNIVYSLPGTGYLTAANMQHLYEAKPVLALTADSLSGSQLVGSSDSVMKFTVTETGGAEKITVRAATELTTTAAGAGALCTPAADTDAGDQVDGSSALCTTAGNTAADTFAFVATAGQLSDNSRVNFWIKWTDAAAVASPTFTDIAIGTNATSAVTVGDQTTALSQTACGADQSTFVTGEWYNCDVAMPTGTDASDAWLSIELVDATELLATDLIHVDSVKLYNEKIVVNVATDTDLDTYANNTNNAGGPVTAYLKDGSTTVATAYWSSLTNGASATTTGTAAFIPTTAFEVGKSATKTLTLVTDTSALLAEDASVDDPVTFSITNGTALDGTVTAGGFWWYETNAIVKWLGEVANTKLNSNTIKY